MRLIRRDVEAVFSVGSAVTPELALDRSGHIPVMSLAEHTGLLLPAYLPGWRA